MVLEMRNSKVIQMYFVFKNVMVYKADSLFQDTLIVLELFILIWDKKHLQALFFEGWCL